MRLEPDDDVHFLALYEVVIGWHAGHRDPSSPIHDADTLRGADLAARFDARDRFVDDPTAIDAYLAADPDDLCSSDRELVHCIVREDGTARCGNLSTWTFEAVDAATLVDAPEVIDNGGSCALESGTVRCRNGLRSHVLATGIAAMTMSRNGLVVVRNDHTLWRLRYCGDEICEGAPRCDGATIRASLRDPVRLRPRQAAAAQLDGELAVRLHGLVGCHGAPGILQRDAVSAGSHGDEAIAVPQPHPIESVRPRDALEDEVPLRVETDRPARAHAWPPTAANARFHRAPDLDYPRARCRSCP